MPDYHRLDPDEVGPEVAQRLCPVYRDAFGEEDPEMIDEFEASVEFDAALPGFGMVVAEDRGRPVGFAYGYTVTADERWRRTAPVRRVLRRADNFHVVMCAVTPGTADEPEDVRRRLLAELLAGRAERHATLHLPMGDATRAGYEMLGWRCIGSIRSGATATVDILARELSPG